MYFEHPELQTSNIWKVVRPSSGTHYIKLFAMYVKSEYASSYYAGLKQGTNIDGNSSNISASEVSGYDFLCWSECVSIGYVGQPYINDRTNKTAVIYDYEKGQTRRAIELHVNSEMLSQYRCEQVEALVDKVGTNELVAPIINGYSFICWVGFGTTGYIGTANARDYMSRTAAIYDYRISSATSSSKYIGFALYGKK